MEEDFFWNVKALSVLLNIGRFCHCDKKFERRGIMLEKLLLHLFWVIDNIYKRGKYVGESAQNVLI